MNSETNLSPLFVDLDGSLIFSDLLIESFIGLLKQNPFYFFVVFFWLIKGKAYLKSKIAEKVNIDISSLPYNEKLIEFLRTQKSLHRQLYLLTASHEKYAKQVADHLGLFNAVYASNHQLNMKGGAKLALCQEKNDKFSYVGNDAVDFKIFAESDESFLVNPSYRAKLKLKNNPVDHVWYTDPISFKTVSKGLRIHQWLKNTLILVPLLVSGLYTDMTAITYAILGFFLFSLLASATYVLNDVSDLSSDRQHPRKKSRPIPSGTWPLEYAIITAIVIFIIVVGVTLLITPLNFQLSLFAYLLLTLTYTFYLKNFVIADVISLASLFTIRIIAGAMIISVELSFWLLAFSMFTFFSLALVKRCAELKVLSQLNQTKTSGRDYLVDDYYLMQSFGVTSAFVSLLIMSFYVQMSLHDDFYQQPILLWATLPAFAYWLCRMWLKTNRGEMHDDPIVFSIKDKGSLVTISFIILITLVAKLV